MPTIDIAARRYAVALLEVATESGVADRCLTDLTAFQREIARIPELRDVVNNPSMPREVTAKAVDAVAKMMRIHEVSAAFLGVLASRRRLGGLSLVLAACAEEQDRRAGRARGELVSAGAISPVQLGRVREAIGKAVGRNLVLTQRLDPSLVGGLRVTVGDRVYDMSVRAYLDSLRTHLLESR
ncbi:MAG: ATP synthase F1 subunit delta [Deltaproteobacteria bacterium]|nr:ATP synthase F1 subunit delta [Deltaproteobacteria bacterium]